MLPSVRVLRILASRWATFLSLGFFALLGLLLSPCFVGIPVLIGVLVSLAGAGLDASCDARHRPTRRASGGGTWVAAISIFAFLATTLLAGAAAIEVLAGAWPDAPDAVARVAFVVAAVLVAACLSPLAYVPFAATYEGTGLSDAAFHSAHASTRHGYARQIGTVASSTSILFSPVLLDAALSPIRSVYVVPWAIALVVCAMVATPTAFVVLADAYVAAGPATAANAEAGTRSSRGAGLVLLWAAAALAVLLCAAIVAAALVPSPMSPFGPPLPRPDPTAEAARGQSLPRVRIAGTSLSVRATKDGLVVEADDGGGVGRVRTRSIGEPARLWVRRVGRRRDAPVQLIVATAHGRAGEAMLLDSRGVRLDDGVWDRWSRRVGSFGALLLGFGAVLAIVALWRIVGMLVAARHLDRAPVGDAPATVGVVAALDGRLRLSPGASLWMAPPRWGFGRGSAEVRGDVWLETDAGALRVRIPPGALPALFQGPSSHPLGDGDPVSVVGRLGRLGRGTRDAELPWPASATLVAGDHEGARALMTARAMRSWAALAAVLMLALAACLVSIAFRF